MSEFKLEDAKQARMDIYTTQRLSANKNKGKNEPFSLTAKDILEYIPVGRTTLYNWIRIGYFPVHYKVGIGRKRKQHRYWRASDVIGFINKCISNDNSYSDHMKAIKEKGA